MSEYIYVIRPTRIEMLTSGPTPEEERIVGEHFQYLVDLNKQGVVILAGRTQTADAKSFGIVILQARDESAAREITENDPVIKHGVMRYELYPYKIAVN